MFRGRNVDYIAIRDESLLQIQMIMMSKIINLLGFVLFFCVVGCGDSASQGQAMKEKTVELLNFQEGSAQHERGIEFRCFINLMRIHL